MWGPTYTPQDESGIPTIVPPRNQGRDYAILVPQVDADADADGNDMAGIRSVDVAAPLATETGWNTSARPDIVDQAFLVGSEFPLPERRADRLANGDSRLSLEERYGDQAGYVAAVTAAGDCRAAHNSPRYQRRKRWREENANPSIMSRSSARTHGAPRLSEKSKGHCSEIRVADAK